MQTPAAAPRQNSDAATRPIVPAVPVMMHTFSLSFSPTFYNLSATMVGSLHSAAQRATDDLLHDLVGPAIDPGRAGIAPESGNRIFIHITRAAMQLQHDIG